MVRWAGLSLNPHPLKAKGAAPKFRVGECGAKWFVLRENFAGSAEKMAKTRRKGNAFVSHR